MILPYLRYGTSKIIKVRHIKFSHNYIPCTKIVVKNIKLELSFDNGIIISYLSKNNSENTYH